MNKHTSLARGLAAALFVFASAAAGAQVLGGATGALGGTLGGAIGGGNTGASGTLGGTVDGSLETGGILLGICQQHSIGLIMIDPRRGAFLCQVEANFPGARRQGADPVGDILEPVTLLGEQVLKRWDFHIFVY